MTELAKLHHLRTQTALLDLLGRASDAAPHDLAAARRFADACMRSRDVTRAPDAWRRVLASDPGNADAWHGLANALLEIGDVEGAVSAGAKAIALAPGDGRHYAGYGFALRTNGDHDSADVAFQRGYDLDSSSPHLARGVGQAMIRRGDGAALAAHCEALMSRIATTGWLIAQYATALAMLGRGEELAALIDYDRLMRVITLAVPDGFESLEAFNAALRAEQEALGSVPSGRAAADVVQGARRIPVGLETAVMMPGEAGAPASAALLRAFEREQRRYEAWLAASGDSLHLRSKPSDTWLRTETIITPRQGYIAPHTHACTWLSGVYYAAVPDGLEGKEGCVEFGPPLHKVALPEGIWPTRLIRPRAGMLNLFPGYFYHQVYPTSADGDRVVVTFDVKPTDESRVIDAGLSPALAARQE